MILDVRMSCVVLGGGGHAKVLIDCILTSGCALPYAILDADCSLWGQELLGVPIKGGDDLLSALAHSEVYYFVVGVGGVGDNRLRSKMYELGSAHKLSPLTVIHPSAVYSGWAQVGVGAQLFPGSIVNAGASLGMNVIVNSGAIVEHDCVLDDHCHIATGAKLAGGVQVGRLAHIGAGASVKQGVAIGESAVVGAGAVVVRDVDPHVVVAGVPARFLYTV
jgi:sugar O-acyltransferase (sialic acid O-acetyltransferase NeuD family)